MLVRGPKAGPALRANASAIRHSKRLKRCLRWWLSVSDRAQGGVLYLRKDSLQQCRLKDRGAPAGASHSPQGRMARAEGARPKAKKVGLHRRALWPYWPRWLQCPLVLTEQQGRGEYQRRYRYGAGGSCLAD